MKKALKLIWDNILFIETIFLLIFIPLYPKLPLLDIRNTWVYIRAEDFIVFFVLISWIILLVKEKITFKTPLTIPILIFWIIGAIATIHGVLLIFPEISNVYPNVAFLSLLRHIEYMSVFFIAFAAIKTKKQLNIVVAILIGTLVGVIFYGFGQKYLGFSAYLTMNEEFAKGVPLKLSELSRVPSTFAGHYDLAAYLVFVIPILVSLFFGVKNWIVKIVLLIISFLGFILLFMTVSRVSFVVLFAALLVVFFFQKKKLVLLSIPLGIIFAVFLLTFQSSLFDRFKSTVSEVDVVVDAKTGESVGHVKFVEKDYFKDKLVLQNRVKDSKDLAKAISDLGENSEYYSSASAIVPFKYIPPEVPLVQSVNISTGESLGQGTGYINLYLSPVVRRIGNFYLELPPDFKSSPSAQVLVLHGDFIVKRASAYDLSFTTRFQGEWPHAIEAFKRNVFLGSGYGSVSLAVDNNYLRILGEIGIVGFLSFFLIFLSLAIYIRKVFPDIDSKFVKSYIIGFGAGVIGLALNATLIDVFEASKIAFLLWIMSGVTFGVLLLYQKTKFDLFDEIKKVATSTYAIIVYLFFACLLLFSPTLSNYFVGDDFTWLRWAADSKGSGFTSTMVSYFTQSDGFFYRPGTKLFFYFMYHSFWLNQIMYHLASMLLHFAVASLFYLLARKIFKNNTLAAASAFIFVALSGTAEAILWISSIGHLITAALGLLGLLFFILWDEKKKIYYFLGTVFAFSLALLFQEISILFPLLIPAYILFKDTSLSSFKSIFKRWDFLVLFVPVVVYLTLRFISQSHWTGGDYSYNYILFPFNFVGNAIGYALLTLVGPLSISIYTTLRNVMREHILIAILFVPLISLLLFALYKFVYKSLSKHEKSIVVFGLLFFIITLLPVIGLGNIASRHDYMASMGLVLIFVLGLKKIYEYLLSSGKEIAIGTVVVIFSVFALFHIIQVQQSYFEWREAGNRVKNFFISYDALYESQWASPDAQFHFVNVPVKIGSAWIFPVGLNDAVWFAFRNENAKVFVHQDLKEALDQAQFYRSRPVLQFNEDGTVEEIDKFRGVPMELIKP